MKGNDGSVVALAVRLEALEMRALLSASSAGACAVTELSLQSTGQHAQVGFAPQQIRNAYGFDQVSFGAGTVPADGNGQTIAIVDAYSDPNLTADLHIFDQQFGFNDPASLQQVGQTGGAQLPAANSGWAAEISLDVEWAHAMAPGANILVVEADSSSLSDLLSAVDSARNALGVSVVSMSWGTSEFDGETSLDSLFTTPAGHQGVSFVASSGDDGSALGPTWPASSGNVISVGGTDLSTDSNGNYASETAWAGSGQGISSHEPEPTYQAGVQNTGARVIPDVSYDANPNDGYLVYDSVPDAGTIGWKVTGGTSAGAPQWAALIAIANQGRATAGLGSLDGVSQTLPALYQAAASGFNAISQGTSSFIASTQASYQPGTGLGTPKAAAITTDLSTTNSVANTAELGDATPPPLFTAKPVKGRGQGHFHPHVERPPGPKSGPSIVPARAPSTAGQNSDAAGRTERVMSVSNSTQASNSLVVLSAGSLAANASTFSRSIAPAVGASGVFLAGMLRDGAALSDSAGGVIFEQAVASLRAAASTAVPIAQVAAHEIFDAVESPAVANVVTNFIHVNALAAFADATAAFINECATIPNAPAAAAPHRTRAWLITAGVLAVDALLVAHWYATRKKEDEGEQGGYAESVRFPFLDGSSVRERYCG